MLASIFNPLVLLALIFTTTTLAVQPLEIRGSDFVNSVTGDRFLVLGIAYQPGGSSGYSPDAGRDTLSDGSICLRDAALMQKLGVNAIRVYNVDPSLNHDDCASIFNAVGIYMMIDVNSPLDGESIDRSNPSGTYTTSYLKRTFAVVEAFKDYQNTMLFFSGNEVINDPETGGTVPPYIRAVTRDLKKYISKHSRRTIPVGYCAADVGEILLDTWNYLQCTTTGDQSDPTRVDLFALNSYSWCGESSYSTSGYDQLVSKFGSTSVPVFFSEFGCNVPSPRIFTEVSGIYSPEMTKVFSGGVVYEYSQEESNYGLVDINRDGSAQLRSDFDALQTQYNTVDLKTLVTSSSRNATSRAPNCRSSMITEQGFVNSFRIPDTPSKAKVLIQNGIDNPNNGKIVEVKDTSVTQKVSGTNRNAIENLAISPIPDDQSNSPSGQTTSPPSPPTTSEEEPSSDPADDSKEKSGVSKIDIEGSSMVALVLMLGLCVVLV